MNTKLQPQAPDMEQAVLGALLLEKDCYNRVTDILSGDDFYVNANRYIYEAIAGLAMMHHPVDMLTVTEELKQQGKLEVCGGPFYISQLTSKIASTAHVEYHALVIKEKAHARRLIRISSILADKAHDPTEDIYELQEKFEKEFTALVAGTGTTISWDMAQTLKAAIDEAARRQELQESGKSTAIPTGIPALDKALDSGLQPRDLIIVAGRPSMGKTQIALWMAKAAAQAGNHVMIASAEMGEVPVVNRFILEDERINPYNYRTGTMQPEEWEAMDESVAGLWNLPIRIAADSSIRKLNNIRSEARRLKRIGQLDLLLVDHLGLLESGMKYDMRYQEVGYITRELKNLAKELEIPVILVSQLNRPMKGLRIKPPVMEDLRESGDIEQDADIILFLHKPEYYDPNATDTDGRSWKNRGQIIIAKYREGVRNAIIPYRHDTRYKKIMEDPLTP